MLLFILLYDLLFPQDLSPLNKCALLYKVECPALLAVPLVQFAVKCRIKELPLAEHHLLVHRLDLSILLHLEQVLDPVVIGSLQLVLLVNL